ncbi:hypothetical protein QR680_015952 [Steinernema hermaphroditum]|uniref:G-protein coupled receptors family 1 profile domain-containing protein n=1 Tax=Steinernema hermaphroditum TaxID=289476 RepID=A0AA39H9I8_9BILA|nr:hypothetical protein QR680_015952 [Steinernema hermaphroditum]
MNQAVLFIFLSLLPIYCAFPFYMTTYGLPRTYPPEDAPEEYVSNSDVFRVVNALASSSSTIKCFLWKNNPLNWIGGGQEYADVNLSLAFVILTTSKIVGSINIKYQFLPYDGGSYTAYIHNACLFFVLDVSVVLSGERIVATWLTDKYEMCRNWCPVFALCLVMWAANGYFSCFSTALLQKDDLAQYYHSVLVVLVLIMMLNFTGFLAFIAIGRYNQRQWSTQLEQRLTHRYQISENIRTSRLLMKTLLIIICLSVFFFGAMYPALILSFHHQLPSILGQLFALAIATTGIILPCSFVKSDAKLLATVKRHFRIKSKDKIIPVHGARPKSCTAKVQEEANVYFSQLQNSWS